MQEDIIKDFTPYMDNSFPSGHTASAFCLFTLLALFVANKKYGLFFLLMALLVAYSRIYLSQHNFIDTYVGAWIGILSALVIYFYFYGANRKFNQKATVMDRSLLKYRK
ncbi:MAG: phosphatase PAP2 family protein [Sphingobacteriales bacterium]|nr:MAG: phosphatase PAP2 family protein [Sphingobacteriales bacterium]